MKSHVVSMKNITKKFGEHIANDNVSFHLKKGSIHGLLGENGAGKTTLMNTLYGLYEPNEGEIFIEGKKVVIDTPSKAIKLGIGMVHQHFMLVRPFSVVENIVLGLESEKKPFLDIKSARKKIKDLCKKYNIKVDPDAKISELSVGQQQRVEILSAIYCGADILILDEPTAVLTPQEVRELFEILKSMQNDGKSIIFITHKLEEILEIGDEISILRDGKMIDTVKVKETSKEELTRMMVGRDVLFDFQKPNVSPENVVMKAENLHAINDKGLPALKEISFELREKEILGIAGVDGNGQKELCEVLTGLRPVTKGEIKVSDKKLSNKSPKDFINHGVSHIPEDRQKTGLVMNFSVMKNFIIKEFDTPKFSKFGFLRRKKIKEISEKMVDEYRIKTNGIMDESKNLSGGNQQKIILGREIGSNPNVLIANQPTRGLDIGAIEYVRQRLLNEKEKGVGVLLISADLDEILQLSDRIAVIYEGKIMGIVERSKIDIEAMGLMMAGVRRGVVV